LHFIRIPKADAELFAAFPTCGSRSMLLIDEDVDRPNSGRNQSDDFHDMSPTLDGREMRTNV
jgi:hypothetical protein